MVDVILFLLSGMFAAAIMIVTAIVAHTLCVWGYDLHTWVVRQYRFRTLLLTQQRHRQRYWVAH